MLLTTNDQQAVRPFFIKSSIGDVHSGTIISIKKDNGEKTIVTFATPGRSWTSGSDTNSAPYAAIIDAPYPVVKDIFRRHGYESYGEDDLQKLTDEYKQNQVEQDSASKPAALKR